MVNRHRSLARSIFCCLTAAVLLLGSTKAVQAEELPLPTQSPDAWGKRWLAAQLAAPITPAEEVSAAYLGRVVFTGAWQDGGCPQLFTLPPAAVAAASSLELVPVPALSWACKINGLDTDAKLSEARVITSLLELGAADAVLRLRRSGSRLNLDLLRARDDEVETLGTTPLSGKGARALLTGLRQLLGYDAIVLSQEQDYVLARAPVFTGARELYGVALAGSATAFTIPATGQHGIALLKWVASAGHYATFKIVSTKATGPLAFGTKLTTSEAEPNEAAERSDPTKQGGLGPSADKKGLQNAIPVSAPLPSTAKAPPAR